MHSTVSSSNEMSDILRSTLFLHQIRNEIKGAIKDPCRLEEIDITD